jgi:hypothetical protein
LEGEFVVIVVSMQEMKRGCTILIQAIALETGTIGSSVPSITDTDESGMVDEES